jgi:hypothetical protein
VVRDVGNAEASLLDALTAEATRAGRAVHPAGRPLVGGSWTGRWSSGSWRTAAAGTRRPAAARASDGDGAGRPGLLAPLEAIAERNRQSLAPARRRDDVAGVHAA